MSRHVTTTTRRLAAWCASCEWTTDAGNGLGNAARHHDATGHTVTVEVDRTIVYGNPHAQPDAQTTILDDLTA